MILYPTPTRLEDVVGFRSSSGDDDEGDNNDDFLDGVAMDDAAEWNNKNACCWDVVLVLLVRRVCL